MPGEPDAEPTVNVQYQDVKKYGEQVAAYFIGSVTSFYLPFYALLTIFTAVPRPKICST